MKFININERKPYNGQMVLIKTKQAWLKYYVCQYCGSDIDNRSSFFEEAGGEQYVRWTMDEVEGWIPIEDIEKPEASCKDCRFSLRDYRGVPKVCDHIDRGDMFEEDPYTPMAICKFYEKEVRYEAN